MAQMTSPTSSYGSFPISSVPLDDEASRCWGLAALIGEQSADDHLRSYTSLLIALVHGDNTLSRWFSRYCRAAGVDLEGIYASKQFRPQSLPELRTRLASGSGGSGKPELTVSVRGVADEAAQLVSETGGSELGVRHLIGAYLYRTPDAHRKQMRGWGFDPGRDGSALVRQVKLYFPTEVEAWIEVHEASVKKPIDLQSSDPILPPKISGFAPDTPEGEDQLDIEADVYALSALICSTRVSPPLSIGLFGDWGSGKSFFIRQLQRGVGWISEDARNSEVMQKDVPFFKNVVQIEFNAWNYSGGNLWASLVQHILENLKLRPNENDDLVTRRLNHLKQEMELEKQVVDAATKRQRKAQSDVEASRSRLSTLRRQHQRRVTQLQKVLASDVLATVELPQSTVAELNRLRHDLHLPAAAANAGEFLTAVEGARKALSRFTALIEYVPPEQRQRFVRNSVLLLTAPPVLALALGGAVAVFSAELASLSAFVAWASGTLAFGARWLRQRTEDLSKPLARLEALQGLARQRVEAEEQKFRAEAASLKQEIALAKDEILAAQAQQQQAESNLERIQAELSATTPARVLADFVRERSESEDYRQHLGLPAVIRRDFERISKMVSRENSELERMTSPEQEKVNAEARINRIVLYIDDLDRCPEPLVVEVLKAVHLLLAFPLFVVVVAVDARWVSRSLALEFPGLLTPDGPDSPVQNSNARGHATPGDYLEKIFQIPLWLRAPDEGAVKRMVRVLVGQKPAIQAGGGHGGQSETIQSEPTGDDAAPVFKRRRHDRNATALDIHPVEVEFIESLAPLLGRSPRSLKRFVNLYRIFKASLSPEEEDGFLDQPAEGVPTYQSVLLVLAVVSGMPELRDPLLDSLLEDVRRRSDRAAPAADTLEAVLQPIPLASEAAAEQHARLMDWLDQCLPGWKPWSPDPLLTWVPRVARYSFYHHRA